MQQQKFCFIVLSISLAALIFSCSSGAEDDGQILAALAPAVSCPSHFELKGDRLFGMDILDPSETGTFEEGFQKAREAGIEFFSLHIKWTSIETSANTYSDPDGSLAAMESFCSSKNIKFSLTIRPIDLTGKTVPADLASTRFNDTAMKTRFKALMDYIFSIVDHTRLTSLQVGNEIDGYDYSGEHADFWSDYGDFLFEIKQYAAASYGGLKIGFTGTHHGLTDSALEDAGVFTALAGVVDVLGVTYYPQNSQYMVKSPDVVAGDMQALVDAYPGKTIYLQEVGYQGSAVCGSSDNLQAAFWCSFFQAWDKHRDVIKLANATRLHDVSAAKALELAGPYGVSDNAFLEYLRTLGLRTHGGQGSDKAGFLIIKEQANARGWQ